MARKPTTKSICVVQGNYGYGHGWEDLTAEDSRKECLARLREYRANESGPLRVINRRVKIGAGLGRARLAGGGRQEKFSRMAEVFRRGRNEGWFSSVIVDEKRHEFGPFSSPEDAQKAARLAYRRLGKQR